MEKVAQRTLTVSVRLARLVDYQQVKNLNRDIYTGFDYIDYMFFEFLHLKHFVAIVGEINGNVVCLILYQLSLPHCKRSLSGLICLSMLIVGSIKFTEPRTFR